MVKHHMLVEHHGERPHAGGLGDGEDRSLCTPWPLTPMPGHPSDVRKRRPKKMGIHSSCGVLRVPEWYWLGPRPTTRMLWGVALPLPADSSGPATAGPVRPEVWGWHRTFELTRVGKGFGITNRNWEGDCLDQEKKKKHTHAQLILISRPKTTFKYFVCVCVCVCV